MAGCQNFPSFEEFDVVQDKRPYITIKVKKDDTLSAIAKRYKVSIQDVMSVNKRNLSKTLQTGQFIRIPKQRNHTVMSGESISLIASAYGVKAENLIKLNKLKKPYRIKVGQRLKIPFPVRYVTNHKVLNQKGSSHNRGESAQSIHPPHKAKTLISELSDVSVGHTKPKFTRSSGEKKHAMRGAGAMPDEKPRLQQVDEPLTPVHVTSHFADPPMRLSNQRANVVESNKAFTWPVRGAVIGGYGKKVSGKKNDGINIASAFGTPVKAARKGTVSYVGNEVSGFGNIILIRHDNGFITAYGHLSEIYVGAGVSVNQGDKIGLVGKTGNVSVPQLHFEIRKNTKSVDPVGYLE